MKKVILLSLFIFAFLPSFTQHWTVQNSGVSTGILYGVSFATDSVGYAVGNDGTNNFILKTTDGGSHWTNKNNATTITSLIRSVYFTSKDTGYIAGKLGGIYETLDGGNSWTFLNPGTSIDYNFISFHGKKTGYAVGKSGLLTYTLDAGYSWQSTTILASENLSKIVFANDTTYYLFSNSSGKTWKTQNGGKTWDTLKASFPVNINDGYFLTNLFGFIAGPSGFVKKTINGGTSWTSINPAGYSKKEFTSVYYYGGGLNGFVAGDSGVLYTINGGTTWAKDTVLSQQKIYAMCFPDTKTGYVVGANGLIMKRIVPKKPIDINNYNNDDIILIYPNPTDGKLTIKSKNAFSGKLNIIITDIQGKIDYQGSSTEINISNYPKGFYFIEVSDGKYLYTKKIIRK